MLLKLIHVRQFTIRFILILAYFRLKRYTQCFVKETARHVSRSCLTEWRKLLSKTIIEIRELFSRKQRSTAMSAICSQHPSPSAGLACALTPPIFWARVNVT